MINESQLKNLLKNLESDRVERTVSTNATDKFSQAVCAFANDLPNHRQPGYLLLGVNKDGSLSGLEVTEQLLENLGALRSDGNILPLPVIAVAKFSFSDGDVAVVEVKPSDLLPVRYKGQICIRVGPRMAVASEQEERLLTERSISRTRSFDAGPMPGASLADLSLALFTDYRAQVVASEVIASNSRLKEEQLASLRFYDSTKRCPTVAGVLLFGKDPRFFLPGSYVQYLKLHGATLTDVPDDQSEIGGDLSSVLRELDARVNANVHTSLETISALREESRPDYPPVAIRELLLNAIMHRDYQSNTPVHFYWFSDHIEIHSPGGLYGEVTQETLRERSSYRNPIIAEAMKALGYVNRFGYGIQRAEAELKRNGNPPPEFNISDRYFLAVIRRRCV